MSRQNIVEEGAFTREVRTKINENFAELYAGGTGESFVSPTITGTVLGGATYDSPVLVTPALGTPASGVGTNLTGTAAGLTAGVASAVAVGGITGLGTGVGAALAIALAASGGLAANGVGGVAAGYRLARVEMALDGSNPSSWAHGLTTVIAAGCSLKGSAAPGVGTCLVTAVINGAAIDFYAWKPTGSGDCTLIASTGTESIYAWAIGT